MSNESPKPDFGEVRWPGLIGRVLGRLPRIIREANFAAATVAGMPVNASVVKTDPQQHWIIYKRPDRVELIRFRASTAWLAGEPTVGRNDTPRTKAVVLDDRRVVVHEGLHRTRATARDRLVISEEFGGSPGLLGLLDFRLGEDEPLPDTSSVRAVAAMLGGDLNAQPVPAR